MIPVLEQPEPSNFAIRVGNPGAIFLAENPQPTSWENKEFWREILPDLHDAYRGICAYCAEWIPVTTSVHHCDHFLPRKTHPHLAYTWRNYRLASPRFNSRKGTSTDILDPFAIEPEWFVLDFPSLEVKPNPLLSEDQYNQVDYTITRLGLSDELCVKSRVRWVYCYCNGDISFNFLKCNAPFISYELERQNLVDTIKLMMRNAKCRNS